MQKLATLVGRRGRPVVVEPDAPDFKPIRLLEIEIGAPIPDVVESVASNGRAYGQAWALVRLHSQPLGMVELALDNDGVSAAVVAETVWSTLAEPIRSHLRRDGLPEPTGLPAAGLPTAEIPTCLKARAAFLADPPFLSVVIPTRERPDRLATCLDSILESVYPEAGYEVVVVDNAPTSDATAELIRRRYGDRPRIRYARGDKLGSASARNRGMEVATGEILVFTDDDVRVDAHWLTEVARAFVAADDVGCVTGLLLPMELETPAQVWFEQYGGFSRGFKRKVYDLNEHRVADPLYPYTAGIFGTGNNMAFRATTLAAIGGFDPALGNGTPALGGVDSEVLLRTILAGHRIVYEPAALVHHLHRRDYAGLHRQVYSYGVGLTAYLLKTMLANPRLIPGFILKVPRGLAFALNPRSQLNEKKQHDYPKELTRLECKGMLYGPIAYARSRRAFGPHRTPARS